MEKEVEMWAIVDEHKIPICHMGGDVDKYPYRACSIFADKRCAEKTQRETKEKGTKIVKIKVIIK